MAENARQTKAERREASRERARQLKLEQERRARRNKFLAIAGAVVGFIVIVAVVAYIVITGMRSPMDEFDGERPDNTADDGSIVIGADGAGQANDDSAELQMYADYMCVHCANLENVNAHDIETMVDDGDATFVLHPVAYLDPTGDATGFSSTAMAAIAVVADGAPEYALPAHQALFGLYELAASGVEPDDQMIAETLLSAGVPEDVAERVNDDEYIDWVNAATAQARNDGISGTPTVYIDGNEFGDWATPGAMYREITGEEPPPAPEPEMPAPPEEAPVDPEAPTDG